MTSIVSQKQITSAIRDMGLCNRILFVHSSLKSFGFVEGGANAVIDALIAEGCTVVVPTFYYQARFIPINSKLSSQEQCYDFNPMDDDSENGICHYRPSNNMIAKGMGAIPSAMLKRKDMLRGNHPLNSFSAVGPMSKELIDKQQPLDVYGPIRRAYELKDAFLILMGVDLTKATPIHFAEKLSGKILPRAWAKITDTLSIETEVGKSSKGFNHFTGFVKELERNVTVGDSIWRVFPLTAFVDRIVEVLGDNSKV